MNFPCVSVVLGTVIATFVIKKQNFNSLKINWKVLCITNFDPFVTKRTMFSSTTEQYNFSSYSLAVYCTGSKSCTHSLLLMQWVNMMLSVA